MFIIRVTSNNNKNNNNNNTYYYYINDNCHYFSYSLQVIDHFD